MNVRENPKTQRFKDFEKASFTRGKGSMPAFVVRVLLTYVLHSGDRGQTSKNNALVYRSVLYVVAIECR